MWSTNFFKKKEEEEKKEEYLIPEGTCKGIKLTSVT
jgi:hypothetical protein